MIDGYIRREMTVDTDQKYQEKFEAAANIIFQKIYQINKLYDYMAIPAVEEVTYVSSYPLLESVDF